FSTSTRRWSRSARAVRPESALRPNATKASRMPLLFDEDVDANLWSASAAGQAFEASRAVVVGFGNADHLGAVKVGGDLGPAFAFVRVDSARHALFANHA